MKWYASWLNLDLVILYIVRNCVEISFRTVFFSFVQNKKKLFYRRTKKLCILLLFTPDSVHDPSYWIVNKVNIV